MTQTGALAAPDDPTSLTRLVESAAARGADRPALIAVDGCRLSYGELAAAMAAIRSCLRDLGIAPGDRVAMTVADGLPAAVSFIGLAPACALAPFNPHYTAAEFDRLFADLRPRALVVAGADPAAAIAAAEARGVPVWRIVAPADDNGWRLDGSPVAPPAPDRPGAPTDVALMLYTSGTTSRPKLVPLTQGNLCASAWAIARTLALTPGDRCLNVMPLFHIHGLVAGLLASLAGGSERGVHAGIQRGRLSRVGGRDRPDLVHGRADDAPGRAGARRAAARRGRPSPLPFRPVVVGGAVAAGHGGDRAGVRGAGRRGVRHDRGVAPDGEQSAAARAAEAGYRRAAGGSGDRDLRGGSRRAAGGRRSVGRSASAARASSPGYSSNPEANAAAFADGWFRTGDQGTIDADGYLTITGRIKEIINRGGEKIAPREVDEALLAHPAVASRPSRLPCPIHTTASRWRQPSCFGRSRSDAGRAAAIRRRTAGRLQGAAPPRDSGRAAHGTHGKDRSGSAWPRRSACR